MTEAPFRRTLGIALAMLIVQYLLGTTVNLFVKIPGDHPGANPPEYFGGVATSVSWAILNGGLWLALPAALGLVLVLAAVGTLVQAIRLGGAGRITLAALGFVGVLGAGFQWRQLFELSRGLQLDADGGRLLTGAGRLRGAALFDLGAVDRSSRRRLRRCWNSDR